MFFFKIPFGAGLGDFEREELGERNFLSLDFWDEELLLLEVELLDGFGERDFLLLLRLFWGLRGFLAGFLDAFKAWCAFLGFLKELELLSSSLDESFFSEETSFDSSFRSTSISISDLELLKTLLSNP